MILLIISFIAGVLTILAPCTLPLLPVIIGGSVTENNPDGTKEGGHMAKALRIALSLGASVILFTMLLKVSTLFINIPPMVWTIISGVIILFFGVVSLFPTIWEKIPFIAKLNVKSNKLLGVGFKKKSIAGDIIIGASLGPVFSTCSPTYFVILATVLPQSLFLGLIYLLVYAAGLVGVLLLVAFLGNKLVSRLGGISDNKGWFKKGLGILFILIGLSVLFGFDKKVEVALSNSGIFDITKIEQKLLQLNDGSTKGGVYEMKAAPEITDPSGYINTEGQPIMFEQYKGNKVVLVDFWTYSCINCQRTTPYLNAWYEKYKDQGLVIVGVHTPEFGFEKVQKNVESAVKKMGITYPVVMDNEYGTWRAFGNQYWPRKYLINAEGTIVYDHIGEGGYEETERQIQKALQELNGDKLKVPTDIVNPKGVVSSGSGKVKSPEIYFGASRNQYLANGTPGQTGLKDFSLPDDVLSNTGELIQSKLKLNKVYMEGKWNTLEEETKSAGPGKIYFKYNAKNVYMVASSELPEGTTIIIKKDGVTVQSITVQEDTLYTLIEGDSYGEHVLEIDVPEAGFDAFTFTFG